MYVNAKQRINKKEVKVFYIYLCESARIDGKVKNTQRYVGSIKENELDDVSEFLANKGQDLTDEELEKVEKKLDELANKNKI